MHISNPRSFWHFDDFGWGSTRRVVGEDKKTVFVQDVQEVSFFLTQFDVSTIPLKSWGDHEKERIDKSEFTSVVGDEKKSYFSGSIYGGVASAYSADYSSTYSTPAPMIIPPSNRDSYMSFGTSVYNRNSWLSTSDSNIAVLPSDQEILDRVKVILASADLMTVTKKKVREELGVHFGVDLSAKRDFIHKCIDQVLKNEI